MEYAQALEVCVRKDLWVQIPPSAPRRKSQRVLVRLAEFIRPFGGLGGHFVLNFRGKNELAILKEEKKNF